MKRKSKISRSVYQHVVEENKKLLRDIKILTTGRGFKAVMLRMKWKDRFKNNTELNKLIGEMAVKYFKEYPELKFKKDLENQKEGVSS